MSPEDLVKTPTRPLHLNVRMTGDDVRIFEELQRVTPGLNDSQRVRDAVRIAVFVLLKQGRGERIPADVAGQLGVFR